ncbi:ribonuclease H2 subunit B isoform X2 [Lingula anatina]|uniref:Ribonuclease H2 subunit B isoform X2 n=1 Tax=Lingula anatina TaxID=7574 RepID=A0A2R2MQU3_LINAN|nr:ribonuclease H2 subunit B isoform X2 [Lingula anatina]|eukprot:XP_023932616.1 ribonuclease H2 subunit B isoform X2 [Lingula anatina]
MCDMRGDDDFKAYKYSQDKTLSWLQAKVEQLADELEKRKVHVAGGAVVATYVKSKKDDNTKRDDYLRFACGIVSDYLPLELGKDLKTHLNIPEPSPVKSSPSSEPPAKKVRLNGDVTPSEDYSKAVDGESKQKEVKLTAKQKQLSKVDKTGMKSISSFFSPKTKK